MSTRPHSHAPAARSDRLMAGATAHHQAGRFTDAEGAYLDILKTNPHHGDALRLLGTLYIQTCQPVQAVTYLRRATQTQPDNAEIHNNLGTALHSLKKLEEAVPCYEQALRINPSYKSALGNLANTLRDLGRLEEAIERYRQCLRLMPTDPHMLVNAGLALFKHQKADEAAAYFEEALQVKPDYFPALSNLGSALLEQGKTVEAIVQYERALQLKPESVEILVNLGAAFWEVNRLDKAVECYERALRIKPDYAEALVNFGTALWGQGKPDEARVRYEQALRLVPDHVDAITNLGALLQGEARLEDALALYEKALCIKPDLAAAQWRKSLILLARGEYREGWELYETGLGVKNLRGARRFRTKIWDGAPAPGKRLLIWAEQGLGDSLHFVRYAALCKERVGKVFIMCPKPLVRLFKSCPFIDDAFDAVSEEDFDLQTAMMSLPHHFGTTLETVPAPVPYLHIEPQAAEKWSQKFADIKGFRVGLVWAGNAREGQVNANLTDRRRSLHLRQLLPLFEIKNVRFISLQMGKSAAQIEELRLGHRVTDFMNEVGDFVDTAAMIRSLDLVITVDTSVAHLAGALGKPVWILSRYDACWRWLGNRESNPWYPSARVFGQPSMGDWQSVIGKVRTALEAESVR